MTETWGPLAETILRRGYAHDLPGGGKETWAQVARRVADSVMSVVPGSRGRELAGEVAELIEQRVFMPGGRYLAASGRPLHQVQNCVLMRAEDSREGWAKLLHNKVMALMTGAGSGAVYSALRAKGATIRKTGGFSTGPAALAQMVNESCRFIRMGADRRGALWGGLHWWHPDALDWVRLKDWSPELRAMKARDQQFPAPMDMTNISVCLDDDFFAAHADEKHPRHDQAVAVYREVIKRMLKTGEPGFSVDVGENAGEDLRNAPVCSETMVMTDGGYKFVSEIVGVPTTIWTGKRMVPDVVFRETSPAATTVLVKFTGGRSIRCDAEHPFLVERYVGAGRTGRYHRKLDRVDRVPAKNLVVDDILHVSLTELEDGAESWSWSDDTREAYALGYTYGDGSFTYNNEAAEITFCTVESKKCVEVIRSYPGVSSVNACDGRGYIRLYFKTNRSFWGGRSKKEFPREIYSKSDTYIRAFLAGLFDADGNREPSQKRFRCSSKHEGFLRGVSRAMEQIGILAGVSRAGTSTYGKAQTYQLVVMGDYTNLFARLIPCVRVAGEFSGYEPYRRSVIRVQSVEPAGVAPVYCADVRVEEHSFQAEGIIVSNCTEISSRDDSDICNLGSIVMPRVRSLGHMQHVVEVAAAFLLAGTLYSDVPYPEVARVRDKNRRLGLGLMGLHEWLIARGRQYGPDPELQGYLELYARSTEVAWRWADEWGVSRPVKTRAIAPNGTISIVAETTGGIEPVFCTAYKRRYFKGDLVAYQMVVDPVAKRLVEGGIDPSEIEDAWTLAADPVRRVAFQVWVQQYVDHGISSTINLPPWGSDLNNPDRVESFGVNLLASLPRLRGITCYPDGARDGQPLTRVEYAEAVAVAGEEFVEARTACDLRGGSCGD